MEERAMVAVRRESTAALLSNYLFDRAA